MASELIDSITKDGRHFIDTQDEASRQRLLAAATSLIHKLETPSEKVARIGWGEPTQAAALRTAFDLGLLDKLNDEPLSTKALAAKTQADALLVSK